MKCWIGLLFSTTISLLISSCSTSIPEPRYNVSPAKKNIVFTKQFLPTGWADITSKSKQPQIKYWLVNRDYSATIVMRELQTDSTSQKALTNGEMNIAANISLRSKVPENNPDFRVTRIPEVIDGKRKLFSYAYSEKGLLRRVVIFRKQGKLFELELKQEQSSAEFDELTNDLVAFATTLYER